MSDRARTIVVGYDGSPTARAALTWGAERAGEGGSLFVVYAFDLPPAMLGGTTYAHAVADHKEPAARSSRRSRSCPASASRRS